MRCVLTKNGLAFSWVFCSFFLCDVACGLDIKVNKDNSVQIISKESNKGVRLLENQSLDLEGMRIRHCHNYLKLKTLKYTDDLLIDSEAPLFFWGADINHLSISTPQLEFRKDNRIQLIDLCSDLVTLGPGSTLNTEKVNFYGEKLKIEGQLYFRPKGELNFLDSPLHFFKIYGRLSGQYLRINGDYLILRNRGSVDVQELHLMLCSPLSEIHQYGSWTNSCFLQSYGRLLIGGERKKGFLEVKDWILMKPIPVTMYLGKLKVVNIKGCIDLLSLSNSRCSVHIQKITGKIRCVDNNDGSCKILENQSYESGGEPTALLSKGSAYSYIGKSNVPLGGVVSKNEALTEIEDVPGISFLRVDQSDVGISRVKGKGADRTYVTGDSAISIDQSELGAVCLAPGSRADIRKSKVNHYLNHGGTYIEDTEIDDFINRRNDQKSEKAKVLFSKNSSVKSFENHGSLECSEGELLIKKYTGRGEEAKIKIIEKDGAPLIESEESNNMFQGKGATIYMDKMQGPTKVKVPYSTLRKGFVPKLQFINSNVSIYLDYMPDIKEFPVHKSGSFNLHVTLSHDYSNDLNKIFGDTIFFIDMNGYNWKNINADFATKGLEITNAGIMGNYNGRIALEDFLTLKAKEVVNEAEPVRSTKEIQKYRSKDFGRHSNVHLYLQQSSTAGIFSGGSALLEADVIRNKFATTASRTGAIKAVAKKEIRNTCGTIAARRGFLSAPKIINEDGNSANEGDDRRISGRGRKQLFFDVYTAELRNKSGRAQMIFGDRLKLDGGVCNIGSSIRSGGVIDLENCPFMELRSTLQNQAEVGGANIYLSTNKLQGVALQLWTAGKPR